MSFLLVTLFLPLLLECSAETVLICHIISVNLDNPNFSLTFLFVTRKPKLTKKHPSVSVDLSSRMKAPPKIPANSKSPRKHFHLSKVSNNKERNLGS